MANAKPSRLSSSAKECERRSRLRREKRSRPFFPLLRRSALRGSNSRRVRREKTERFRRSGRRKISLSARLPSGWRSASVFRSSVPQRTSRARLQAQGERRRRGDPDPFPIWIPFFGNEKEFGELSLRKAFFFSFFFDEFFGKVFHFFLLRRRPSGIAFCTDGRSLPPQNILPPNALRRQPTIRRALPGETVYGCGRALLLSVYALSAFAFRTISLISSRLFAKKIPCSLFSEDRPVSIIFFKRILIPS